MGTDDSNPNADRESDPTGDDRRPAPAKLCRDGHPEIVVLPARGCARMTIDPEERGRELVRSGYDAIASAYLAERDQTDKQHYVERFAEFLRPGGSVLDVGCGAGMPVDRYLIDNGFDVVGIDISPTQIDLARGSVPEGHYEVRDMTSLRSGEFRVDGVVSLYAIFHTPREEHGRLLKTFASFLRPGGMMLITMGGSDWEGTEPDFYGAEMFWSHYGPAENRSLIEAAGFVVETDEIDGDDPGERHQVILARCS
jgi:cyclopropane fatty-acyl-phospholipid synthase-like methyltransferase